MAIEDLTCLIPFYRTARFLPLVVENIDAHIAAGAHVICSDEHCLDDAAAQVAARYAGNSQVTVLQTRQGGNWVSNCNRLIEACRTPFFRIMPHDDSVPAGASVILTETIRNRPEVVLSHGWVRAETEDGRRLPERDEPVNPPPPVSDRWVFAAKLFWQGLYSGAFKAVMRRSIDGRPPLLIRPTPDLKHCERAWLFGFALQGEFAFSEGASMRKRYWPGSLTHGWNRDAAAQIEVARVMASYVDDFVAEENLRAALRFNLFLNASRRANWKDGNTAKRPDFEPPVGLIARAASGRGRTSN